MLADTIMLSEAFRKFHAGDSLTDNEIVEVIKFLEPMERDGWVLDSRFTFFITEIRRIASDLRGFQSNRIANGRWNPGKDKPQFLKPDV